MADDGAAAPPRAVVAMGASAGGVDALTRLFTLLPADLPAAVLVVLHIPPTGTSHLPHIIARAGPLAAASAREGAALAEGRVLVAPPDRHLLALDGRVRLDVGPKENGHRPAVDVTFRSVAEAYGRRAIGVVLSGTRFDGAAGLGEIVAGGGRALVQDPTDSLFDGMPRSALRHVEVDAVLPVAELARRLEELCGAMGELSDEEEQQMTGQTAPEPAGERRSEDGTRYTCPDCGGVLFHDEGVNGVPRFVCSVGHAYLPEALDDEQARMVEGALWTAARMLGDRATYLREMAERMRGATSTTDFFRSRAEEAEARQRVLLDLMDQAR